MERALLCGEPDLPVSAYTSMVASAGKSAIFGEKIPSRTSQIESSDWPLVLITARDSVYREEA